MSPRIAGRPIVTRASLLATAATLFLAPLPATAATKTWDGGGTNDTWLNGVNWNANTAPAANDTLVFGGTVRLTPVNDFAAGTVFTGLSFAAGAGAFNVTGNGIVLNRSTIANNATNAVTVGLPITIGSGLTTLTTPATGGTMNLSGAFARSTGSTVVVNRVGGNINLAGSGLANDASGILGGWAVIGNDWASLDGSGNTVPYTAYTNIPSGAITTGANLNYRYTADTANITAAAGTAINSLVTTIGTGRTLTLAGALRLGARGGIYRTGASSANSVMLVTGGSLTASGGGEITLLDATTTAANFTATNNNLRIDSTMTDDGANPVAVNIVGYLDIRGTNTYSGGTFINLGRVQGSNTSVFGTGPVTIYTGGQAFLNNNGTFANNFTIAGTGSTETSGGQTMGAIRMNTGATTLSGTITLAENARITGGSGGTNAITGKITGSGRLEFTAATGNVGSITLNNAANDWNGGLLLTVGGAGRQVYVKLGADEQIPNGAGKGSVTIAGASDIARLDLSGHNETINGLNAAVNTFNQVKNTAATPCTLTLGANNAAGDFGGTLDDAGAGAVSLVKTGTGTQIFRGTTNHLGTTTVDGGRLEFVGDLAATGLVTVNSGATLAANAQLSPDVTIATGGLLASNPAAGAGITLKKDLNLAEGSAIQINTASFPAAPVQVLGTLNPTGGEATVSINLTGVAPAVGQYPVISYGALGGVGLTAFKLGTVPLRFQAQLYNDTVNKVIVMDVISSGDFPVWSGALGNEWSTAVLAAPKNWVMNSSAAITTDYLDGEIDLFDDTAVHATPDISNGPVSPLEVRFNNNVLDYVVTGSQGITGTGILVKNGSAVSTLATNNSYSGQTTVNAGTLRIGNGGTSGTAGSGPIANGATLEFFRTDNPTVANVISGSGVLRQSGTGTLTLSGANTYTGGTTVSAGTLRASSNASVGVLPGGVVTVADGGAFDLGGNATANNANFGQKSFVISGAGPAGHGAILNGSALNQQNAFQRVTLAADASIGGTGRFDIRATQVGGVNQAVLDPAGHTLTKVDDNYVCLVSADVGDGNIVVNGGTLSLETTTSVPDYGTGKTVTFNAGTNAQFYSNTAAVSTITRPFVFNGEGCKIANASAVASLVGSPIELRGDVALTTLLTVSPGALTLGGNITEAGGAHGLTKLGTCTFVLAGTSSYTGPTTVSTGTLLVNGALGTTAVTTATGTTFGGAGSLLGPLVVGGTLAPGNAGIGTFTAAGVTLSSTATLAIQLNSGSSAIDTLVAGNLNLGGAALAVTDAGTTVLATGTKLLFAQYSGALTGTFSNVADGGTLVVGPNTFRVNLHDTVAGQAAITLTVPATGFSPGYDSWATAMGLDGTNNGPDQDPDGDGRSNLLEFALAANPLSPAPDGSLANRVLEIDPGTGVERVLTLTLPVRSGAGFSGPGDLVSGAVDRIIYTVQGSVDFTDFTSMNVTEVVPAVTSGLPGLPGGWSYRTFRAPGNVATSSRAFLRVKVAAEP
ncbi:autotransporter-associated beta strand repeat-containing protein [Luteolibacter sp. LG18]|uniref:beta strand repeat-containing protein n=1 Tax=Luteolibacter sp. LG18 TaxID=2819286 RepID=UPI002B2EDC9F|nr:hypothetical protein llg_27900 [Luteolibacter sp. LG18]